MPADEAEDDEPPVALVAPHAGYVYSGPVAASAYARLLRWRDWAGVVAVLGPAHFVALDGLALPRWTSMRTPLGEVPVDQPARDRLVAAALVGEDDRPHAPEHSIEVQFPFLQRVLADGWTCVPIAAGTATAEHVADCLDVLTDPSAPDSTGRPATLVVASTDLSHYLDQASAQRQDRRTAQAIVDRDHSAVDDLDACGAVVVRGLLAWARRHRHGVHLLDLRTSADTAGDPARVVGYGAFTLSAPAGADS
jgi:AmmeMemoRadiSam system protein B